MLNNQRPSRLPCVMLGYNTLLACTIATFTSSMLFMKTGGDSININFTTCEIATNLCIGLVTFATNTFACFVLYRLVRNRLINPLLILMVISDSLWTCVGLATFSIKRVRIDADFTRDELYQWTDAFYFGTKFMSLFSVVFYLFLKSYVTYQRVRLNNTAFHFSKFVKMISILLTLAISLFLSFSYYMSKEHSLSRIYAINVVQMVGLLAMSIPLIATYIMEWKSRRTESPTTDVTGPQPNELTESSMNLKNGYGPQRKRPLLSTVGQTTVTDNAVHSSRLYIALGLTYICLWLPQSAILLLYSSSSDKPEAVYLIAITNFITRLKCCINSYIMTLYHEGFKDSSEEILSKMLPSCKRANNDRSIENGGGQSRDFYVKYTKAGGETATFVRPRPQTEMIKPTG